MLFANGSDLKPGSMPEEQPLGDADSTAHHDETVDLEVPDTPLAPLEPCPRKAPVARMW